MKCRHGFTLIELLFVVATIAILAAIAVPNFLEAQTRTKLARFKAEMSVVSLGLNRYYADHGAFPPNHPEVTSYLTTALDSPIIAEGYTTAPATAKMAWHEENGPLLHDQEAAYKMVKLPPLYYNSRQFNLLTTPVAYLESGIPVDVFGVYKTLRPTYLNSYDLFANDRRTTYSGLWGRHVTSATLVVMTGMGPDGQINLEHPLNGPWVAYDSTNGTASDGDIINTEGDPVVFQPMNPEYLPVTQTPVDYGMDPMLMMMGM